MMSFLLFSQNPGRVVMLGLGGGSLAKFCYRALPETSIVAVEVDPNVIALRRHFAIPEDDARFSVVCADAAEFIAATTAPIDVLLADAFDDYGLAPSMANREFLLNAHASLDPSGMLVMNLAGSKSRYVDVIESAHEIFDFQTVVVPVEDGENHILFAFRRRLFAHDLRKLMQRARVLKRRYGLDFPAFVQKMQRAHELSV
jgi:spermidine synthase